MTAGVTFLMGARNQGGWWRDFYDLNRGSESKGWITAFASDEWVTAYTGTALAGLPDERAQRAAGEAWALLSMRRGAHEGWGYHALLPVDADSTAWGLRLANRLSIGWTERVQHARRFLQRQMRPNGGIACYVAEDCPRIARFLSMDGPYDGWCAVHTCVTAAAALLDLGERPVRFLQATQLEEGRWRGHWWDDDEYTTARAAESLALCGGSESRHRVQRAVEWAASRISSSGAVHSAAHGAPSAFATALCIQILAVADDPRPIQEPLARAIDWLLEHQRPNGSWPPSARLRVPPPDAMDPEERPEETLVYLDRRGIFTTATVLAALSIAGRSVRSPLIVGE